MHPKEYFNQKPIKSTNKLNLHTSRHFSNKNRPYGTHSTLWMNESHLGGTHSPQMENESDLAYFQCFNVED